VTTGYAEFEFDLPSALLAHLVEVLDSLDAAPLTTTAVAEIPREQGVYQLLQEVNGKREVVYIGKTDAESGLRARLEKHRTKTQDRSNLDPESLFFKAVRVYVFTAVDLEAQLIKKYGGVSKVRWNGSGFGSKDPGKERDTTTYKVDHFDTLYPINIDLPITTPIPENSSAADVLRLVKRVVPYLLRFETLTKGSRTAHADLEETLVTVDPGLPLTMRSLIEKIVVQLPPGWHATKLPSHLIVYKNDSRKFPSGERLADSPSL
jgi:hypothetical protein